MRQSLLTGGDARIYERVNIARHRRETFRLIKRGQYLIEVCAANWISCPFVVREQAAHDLFSVTRG